MAPRSLKMRKIKYMLLWTAVKRRPRSRGSLFRTNFFSFGSLDYNAEYMLTNPFPLHPATWLVPVGFFLCLAPCGPG